jgi:hypothetical protein
VYINKIGINCEVSIVKLLIFAPKTIALYKIIDFHRNKLG